MLTSALPFGLTRAAIDRARSVAPPVGLRSRPVFVNKPDSDVDELFAAV